MFLLTAASSGQYADTGVITTMHLTLIAVLIVIVIAAIIWGMRQQRTRRLAKAQEAERNEVLLAHPQTESAVAPAPPPPADRAPEADAAAEPAPEAAAPAGEATAPPPRAESAQAYGLSDVKGLGPKAVPLLAAQGIGDLAALAALDAERAAVVDAGMGALAGRMARDQWIAQAKLLAAGDVAGFEATYGKL